MSEVNRDKIFDRAVDLVINQDHVIQQWTGRYITIQTSLAVAAGVLLSWKSPNLDSIVAILVVLISIIAIVLAHALTQIIKREYEWQERYVAMVKKTEGQNPIFYQEKPIPGKDIPTTFVQIKPYIVVAWILFIIFVLFYWFKLYSNG
ncbi:MAG: hypothetical protein NTW55_01870 [Planctomycetota bacterium]|nr:hypothetical protein [Planctomycetota bacterium]